MFKFANKVLGKFEFPIESIVVAGAVLLVGCVASTPKQESAGEYLNNGAITTQVKAKLLSDSKVKSLPIKVDTYKGRVQLSGFVETQEQIDRAVADAKSVSGVKSVENDLVVR